MIKRYLSIIAFVMAALLYGCSKKNHPGRTNQPAQNNTLPSEKNTDSLMLKKAVAKKKEKAAIPKVITVNDSAARKSVDGRFYYDVMGHRYWRNNKDGKYYLFNKSMYTNDAFKAPE